VKWNGRGLMRRSLALLAVHRDCCPSLVERQSVTLPAQALMKVGTCTTILTDAFVLGRPVVSFIPLSRLNLSRTLFPAVRLSHRSSSHHCTSLVRSGLAHDAFISNPTADAAPEGPEVPRPQSASHLTGHFALTRECRRSEGCDRTIRQESSTSFAVRIDGYRPVRTPSGSR
jgi:hypothetical protein